MPLQPVKKDSNEYLNYAFQSQIFGRIYSDAQKKDIQVEFAVEDPKKYNNLQQYLHFLRTDGAKSTMDPRKMQSRALNMLAARTAMDVEANNKNALIAQSLQGDTKEMQYRIHQAYIDLVNSPVAKEFLEKTKPGDLRKMLAKNGHGGELERGFSKFVRNHEGPLPENTPKRYAPTALERIEALQKQLKGLPKNSPEYANRAADICAEIAATRAAVGCTIGDKSTLKKTYDIKAMNRTQKSLSNVMKDMDRNALNAMVKNALKGHGGAMEPDVKAAVRNDMQKFDRMDANIDPRYQVTYSQRLDVLRGHINDALKAKVEGRLFDTNKFEQDLVETFTLSQLGKTTGDKYREELDKPVDFKLFGYSDGFESAMETYKRNDAIKQVVNIVTTYHPSTPEFRQVNGKLAQVVNTELLNGVTDVYRDQEKKIAEAKEKNAPKVEEKKVEEKKVENKAPQVEEKKVEEKKVENKAPQAGENGPKLPRGQEYLETTMGNIMKEFRKRLGQYNTVSTMAGKQLVKRSIDKLASDYLTAKLCYINAKDENGKVNDEELWNNLHVQGKGKGGWNEASAAINQNEKLQQVLKKMSPNAMVQFMDQDKLMEYCVNKINEMEKKGPEQKPEINKNIQMGGPKQEVKQEVKQQENALAF